MGDSDNDIPMLEVAGIAVAMGNSSPGVNAVADWHAPSVEEDGAAVALKTLVLDRLGTHPEQMGCGIEHLARSRQAVLHHGTATSRHLPLPSPRWVGAVAYWRSWHWPLGRRIPCVLMLLRKLCMAALRQMGAMS